MKMDLRRTRLAVLALGTLLAFHCLFAQNPAAVGGRGGYAYPSRTPGDPASIARGKTLYDTNCSFCHGEDARGGAQGGPNLIRSDIILRDQKGELLAPVVQNGRPDAGMPKFTLSSAETSDLAAFLHSFEINSRDPARKRPPSILVGDARAGEAYFKAKCSSCHSGTGDLKGIGSRIKDARTLQQTWLMPVVYGARAGFGATASAAIHVPPVTVTVTTREGKTVEGRVGRIDDFIVTLTEADGTARSFRRDGDAPKVVIHDPIEPHKDLLRVYTDKDIHDVTAYLVTLK
ncbi:MAG TPA: c-type cytochrome [Bryobacteraceae bacterium]|jgi:mono/diheme cytochrome c family protein